MNIKDKYDVVVIGGGPGGLASAIADKRTVWIPYLLLTEIGKQAAF